MNRNENLIKNYFPKEVEQIIMTKESYQTLVDNLIFDLENDVKIKEIFLIKERDRYIERIDKAIEKLKEHKQDLDYEPWSIYQIEGSILFDLVNILKGSDSNEIN